MSFIIPLLTTIFGIVIGCTIEFLFSISKILFRKPVKSPGALLIDEKERIYAHPAYGKEFKDFKEIGVSTLYDVIATGKRRAGDDRPLFSWRNSSEEKFKSLSYK